MRVRNRTAWLLAALAVAVSLGLWGALAALAVQSNPPGWDVTWAATLRGWKVPGLTGFLEGMTWLSSRTVAVSSELTVIGTLLVARRFRYAVPFILGGLSEVLNEVLKGLIGRTGPEPLLRPEADSFPSGHTFHAAVFFGLLIFSLMPLVPRRWMRWALAALYLFATLSTGVSRVHLGFHWPSDVLGAFLLAVPALAVAVLVHRHLARRALAHHHKNRVSPSHERG